MRSGSATVSFWRMRLPHWEVVDGCYFVTLRLHNTLPQPVLQELRQMTENVRDDNWLLKSRMYFKRMEHVLHHGDENRQLSRPEIAAMVHETLLHYDKQGIWHLMAHSVMPNHAHFLVRLVGKNLYRSVLDFKRYTAGCANRILDTKGRSFWQREWFDHWARSSDEGDKIIRYIRHNPVAAGLVGKWQDWPYSS